MIQVLQDIDEEKEWCVGWQAADALAKIGTQAVPALIRALQDEEWFVRQSAAYALAKIGTQAVPVLIRTLQDRNEYVRVNAAMLW